LAVALDVAAPRLTDFFFEYTRMAVQVFLVIGGYFAASSLAPHGHLQLSHLIRRIGQRYLRLVLPFSVAMLLVLVCSAVARSGLPSEFIPAAPGLLQLLAHAGLLHGVLGVEPLSIGIWYVAIDFQLYVLMAFLLWLGRRQAQWLVAVLTLTSLLVFNLQADGDNWAPYFFGAYGMGAFAWWAGHSRHAGPRLVALAGAGALALLWDFRLRILLALAVALWLGVARWRTAQDGTAHALPVSMSRAVRVLGRCSYALFLTHFCVILLANVAWAHLQWTFAGSAGLVTLVAWSACVVLALAFERYIERPLSGLRLFH
jgi:peptidoglycan/LPS O-acetylase OafA/YrhL